MDQLLRVENFLTRLFQKSGNVSFEDFKNITNDQNSNSWSSWLTDYVLREFFEKKETFNDIYFINLTGSTLLTDQGIIWMCKFLPKCNHLEKISLRSCSNLTENSLLAILNTLNEKCIIEMNHTSLNFIPELSPCFHSLKVENTPLGYMEIEDKKNVPIKFSLIVWPSKSVEISGIGLLTENIFRPLQGNYLEYKSKIKLFADDLLINIINYRYTEVPIHSLVPRNPGHILILVSDNKMEAVSHIVDTVVHFLGSEIPKFSVPIFEIKINKAFEEDQMNKTKFMKQKTKPPMKKSKKRMESNEESFNSENNNLIEEELFGYKNIIIDNGTMRNCGSGVWVSKVAVDDQHSNFQLNREPATGSLNALKIGFCKLEYNWKEGDPVSSCVLSYDIKEKKLVYVQDGALITQNLEKLNPSHSIVMQLNSSNNPFANTGKLIKFFLLEIDGRPSWSRPINVPNEYPIVPFIVFNDRNCSINLTGDWISPGSFTNERTSMVVQRSQFTICNHFTVVCLGEKCEEVYNEVINIDWSKQLEQYMKKLNDLIANIKKKLEDHVDIFDCVQMSEATRQLERLQEFVNKNPKSNNTTVFAFKMKEIDKKEISEIRNSINVKIKEEMKVQPYKFKASVFSMVADELSQLQVNYIRSANLKKNYLLNNFNRAQELMEKMFLEMSGIYIKKFDLFIMNISWFDSLLNEIAKSSTVEANYKALGVHGNSKVWTKETIKNLLDKYAIPLSDHQTWISFLMDLGLLLRIPCIRFATNDELYFYINPMESDSGKKQHLESILKSRDHLPQKLLATIQYTKICEDLYSFYPQLLSRVISLGHLQLLSPLATVIQVSGGVELMIEAGENAITISAYMPQYMDKDGLQITQINLISYIWSVIHLCVDAFDALLSEQKILAIKTNNRSVEPPQNYSVCYSHKWSDEPSNINVCTLCGNCSSSQGIECPYNRIKSQKRGYCLCLSKSSSCQDCGICMTCARSHWRNHCISHPGEHLIFGSDNIQLPNTTVNFGISTNICLEIFNNDTSVFIGLKKLESSHIIDILGVSVLMEESIPLISDTTEMMKALNATAINISLSHINADIVETCNSKYQYAVCKNIDFEDNLGLLTYHHKNDSTVLKETGQFLVGIFVGHYSISQERNSFSIEIVNPGEKGCIVIGLVNANYPCNRQPGWDPVSIAYHGDDGGIYHSTSYAVTKHETFSKIGCKIEVFIEFTKNETGDEVRVVHFKKNGQEVTSGTVQFQGDLFPAIGMHSKFEQVKLLDDLVWKDRKNSSHISENKINDNEMVVSPKDYIYFNDNSMTIGFIHVLPGSHTITSITIKLICSTNVLLSIESLNNLSHGELKENTVVYTVNDQKKTNVYSFAIDFAHIGNIDDCLLKMNAKILSGKNFDLEWKLSKKRRLQELGYKDHLNVIEVSDEQTPPTFPAYLMTISEASKSRYYHITKDDYSLIVKGDKNNFWIKAENLMRPSFTKTFQIGNIISYNSKPSLVLQVKKDTSQIKINGVSESIPFASPLINSLSKPGKPLMTLELSKDGKFKKISHINKPLLLSPPPSRPSLLLFKEIESYENIESDLFFANECNKYHGMNVCLLNMLSMYNDDTKNKKSWSVLALPFNFEGISDFSQFLWEHSYAELFDGSQMLFYPTCFGKSAIYDPRPHLLDVSGIRLDNETSGDPSKLFSAIYLNPHLLNIHKSILNDKFILVKSKNIIQQSRFVPVELEYLIFIILEKITNFMMLHNLITNEKLFFSDTLGLNLEKVFNEGSNHQSLKMDGDALSCRLHSSAYLDEVDLQDLANECNGDVEAIENNHIFDYAEYSQSIIFTGKVFEKIPEKILLRFPNLYSLELRNMFKITQLPESIYGIKGLQKLTISRLKIDKLPQVWRFPSLKSLLISHCPITNDDPGEAMHRLESVKLLSLPIIKCPNFIMDCSQLIYLEIHLTGLITIPVEIKNLQNLKEIKIIGSTLYYDLFTEIIKNDSKLDDEFVFEYPEISLLGINDSSKPIKSMLPAIDAFINVPRIGSGYSSPDDVLLCGGFPISILKLHNLTTLSIHHQSIRFIPSEIQELKLLEILDLSYNPLLESIPAEINHISSIKKINILHCPALMVPPIEVISRGSGAIMAYLKYLLSKKVTCNRTKLMFVGLGEAGKTSLLYALTSSENTAKKIIEDQNKGVTDGIDIGKYTIDLPNNENIQFSTWDFAGQDVYYNTHQFFLSAKAIYIVVWSVRQGIEHGDLDFWLSSISCHAKDAPVFVVGTRCDQVQAQSSSFITLKQRYSQIVDFHLVDSLSGTGIANLRKSLVDVTLSLPYMHQDIPSSILDLENKIMKFRQTKDYVTFKEFENIATEEGILEKDVKNVMQVLHDFGSIQYFNTELLKKYVVINPQWIVDIMANIVSVVDQTVIDGIFYHKDMNIVWKNFDECLHSWMLNLTEEFDLTYPHPSLEPKANIVPCLLTEREPMVEWPLYSDQVNWKYFQINYLFEFLPAGLFNRIQVRLFDFTDTKEIWKYGTYFVKNDHHVLLKRENKVMLTIRAIGVRPVNVLAMIDEVIRNLIRTSFHGVHFQMEIACPDCVEYGSANTNLATNYWSEVCMFPSKVVKKAITKKVEYLQCAELHLNSLKSIKENTPATPSPDEFVNDLYSKVQTIKGLFASSEKIVTMLHSLKDFEESNRINSEKMESMFEENNLTCIRINESRLTKWKTLISNCILCLIFLSENFLRINEMNDILEYVKLIKKSFLLIITGENPQIKSEWIHGPYFNSIHIKMTFSSSGIQDTKYIELADSIKRLCADVMPEKNETYDCFISYCWSNSQDAINKGTKPIVGSISSAEADPRKLYKYLQEHNISCWIDENNLNNNVGLSTQLSRALQNSRIMLAFVSREYDRSDNCKMELRFMVEVLKRPVIYIRVGNNFDKFINSEVLLLMQKADLLTTLDFTSIYTSSKENLLETVKSTLANCPKTIKRRETVQNASNFAALNEQVELIFRQFLNQLIVYNEEHCPRLIVIDTVEGGTDSLYGGLQLRVICENEGGWHVTEDRYDIEESQVELLIENCAIYLLLMFQVLEYKNPGLQCLQANVINNNEFISKISQVARTSEVSLMNSYRHLIQFYLKYDPELAKCSLKRYRLASGRESWMCDKDSSLQSRCKLIEKDAATINSSINPLDEYDKEILLQLKSKLNEEEIRYKESFSTVMKGFVNISVSNNVKHSQPILKLAKQNTFLVTEKDIITNYKETCVVPIRRISNAVISGDKVNEFEKTGSKGLPIVRRQSSVPRQNIKGSRFCIIQ